ncbi:hypothetical protein PsorP6_002192 [Peronosclerospora sorghi]|uniref:Uncharacterized protein n=1 Tax=Peronosclerospora sorghi TaxID=230839 RepID=A0ACC0WXT8_9STRA|nr:hypothetical protein PsorP6_002192 [Peronosclerospora sorghi]
MKMPHLMRTTIGSVPVYPYVEHFEATDVEFLEQLPFTLTLPNHDNIVILHAGFVPDVELNDQRPYAT